MSLLMCSYSTGLILGPGIGGKCSSKCPGCLKVVGGKCSSKCPSLYKLRGCLLDCLKSIKKGTLSMNL